MIKEVVKILIPANSMYEPNVVLLSCGHLAAVWRQTETNCEQCTFNEKVLEEREKTSKETKTYRLKVCGSITFTEDDRNIERLLLGQIPHSLLIDQVAQGIRALEGPCTELLVEMERI